MLAPTFLWWLCTLMSVLLAVYNSHSWALSGIDRNFIPGVDVCQNDQSDQCLLPATVWIVYKH